MTKKRIFALIVGLLFVLNSCASAASPNGKTETTWNPQRTWVFFVGLLEWKDSDSFSSFPQKNRRDAILLDVLRSKGVPESQIVYLKDSQATTANIQKTFETFLTRAAPGDWLFVYFCGHGYKSDDAKETYLVSYDVDGKQNKGWDVKAVPETIDKYFKGSNAIIALDNCYSGAVAEAVKNRRSKVSYAVLASSHFNSSSTSNWTFTESLIYAFRGEPFIDDDADGRITLGEITENSAEDMEFAEEQLAEFALTGDFNNRTVISQAGKADSKRLGERVEALDRGEWYKAIITGAKDGKFKVHYFGYEYDEDAFRSANEIRGFQAQTFSVGSKIDAEWHGKWYPARVLEVKGNAHYITYDGFSHEWDEWVPSRRLRRRN